MKTSTRADRIFGLFAVFLIILAWIIGSFKQQAGLRPFFSRVLGEAKYFEILPNGITVGWNTKQQEKLIAYLTVGEAQGFGGKIKILAAVSREGKILNLLVVDHKETFSFFQRILNRGIIKQLTGKNYLDEFQVGKDIDSVSGATYTLRGFGDASGRAVRKIADLALGKRIPVEPAKKIRFGLMEIILLFLFFMAYIGTLKRIKNKKLFRWISLLTGLILIGFIFNRPVSMTFINKLILGFWSSWQDHFYWYLLFFCIVIFILFKKSNIYCERICPFGAAQESISVISGTRRQQFKGYLIFKWIQRLLTLSVILLALIFRNPSYFNYEVSGVMFHLLGTTVQFVLLGVVLIFSFFIIRPWCNFLCPLRPVFDYIAIFNNWFRELVKKK